MPNPLYIAMATSAGIKWFRLLLIGKKSIHARRSLVRLQPGREPGSDVEESTAHPIGWSARSQPLPQAIGTLLRHEPASPTKEAIRQRFELRPQVWNPPALAEANSPSGGMDSLKSLRPQQDTEPSVLPPQVWRNPALTET